MWEGIIQSRNEDYTMKKYSSVTYLSLLQWLYRIINLMKKKLQCNDLTVSIEAIQMPIISSEADTGLLQMSRLNEMTGLQLIVAKIYSRLSLSMQ